MRSASVAPDLSSSGERVSDTVSTAIRSGTNDFDSSMLGMKPLRSNLEDLTRGRPSRRRTQVGFADRRAPPQDEAGHFIT